MNNIEKFIIFINDLTTELYYDRLYVNGEYLYLNGGCHIFSQIIKTYYPTSNIYIKNNNDHCAIEYQNELYDAQGKIKDTDNYKKTNEEDLIYMNNNFGGQLTRYNIYNTITDELNKINTIDFLYEDNGLNLPKKEGKVYIKLK